MSRTNFDLAKINMAIESPEKSKLDAVQEFFELTQEKESALQERIAKANGLVRIFVHPDFKQYSEFKDIKEDPEAVKRLQEAENAFKRILSSDSESLPPVFVFEGGRDKDQFEKKEDDLRTIAKKDVIVIRTELANPNPLYPDRQRNYRWHLLDISDEERKQMWELVIHGFKRWGVKKILIAGMELYVSPEESVEHGGCLGAAISTLKEHFEIKISLLTWPDKGR